MENYFRGYTAILIMMNGVQCCEILPRGKYLKAQLFDQVDNILEIALVRNDENRKILLLNGPNAKFYQSDDHTGYELLPRPSVGENIKG